MLSAIGFRCVFVRHDINNMIYHKFSHGTTSNRLNGECNCHIRNVERNYNLQLLRHYRQGAGGGTILHRPVLFWLIFLSFIHMKSFIGQEAK